MLQDSQLQGEANILICPSLDAANILFNVLKVVSANGVTVGPILLGSAASAHVLTPSTTLRRVVAKDDKGKRLVFLTNNFTLKPDMIADLYRQRWQVELFFKWIKQHLRIKVFLGTSENAVKTQIWIAICTYVLIAITKKRLHLEHHSFYEILQILSLSMFENIPINQLLTPASKISDANIGSNQLVLL